MIKLLLIIFLFLSGCNKPKVVLICGDHICINKTEAEQYFEENLTLEVKLINKDKTENKDLVELNLSQESDDKKQVSIFSKKKTSQDLKILSHQEIKKKKSLIKKKKKLKDKKLKQLKEKKKKSKISTNIVKNNNETYTKSIKNINNQNNDIVDICLIISNCSIDEISKYLINEGKNKKFPDITVRN